MNVTNDASTPDADDPSKSRAAQKADTSEDINVKLDEEILPSLGLADLPPSHRPLMLSYLRDILDLRVDKILIEDMPDEELDEFEQLMDAARNEDRRSWLERHRPDYRNIAAVEWRRLRTQVSQSAERLLEISQRHPIPNPAARRPEAD